MDLLGSILDSMEKPPQTSSKQEILIKKQQETLKKLNEMEKEKLKKISANIEQRLIKFVNDCNMEKIEFEPMAKIHRTVIHNIADKHDLIVYSFGVEDVDRHCVVYKKEFKPTEEELDCLRNGEDIYDRKLKELHEKMKLEQNKNDNKNEVKKGKNPKPNTSYTLKYANIIGLDVGEAAAKITTPNQQFGMVPSSNKRDQRSIEQILNDNKNKKLKNL
ncbi:sperm-associated antigen 7 homolog [Dermatophagoides pteronyssinus]|uniref:sperm-associated antigen 7 homolog n=1 Tax=Dermatophagoides pteronyssinus TaxID=6956 RepID=UPI003F67CE9A